MALEVQTFAGGEPAEGFRNSTADLASLERGPQIYGVERGDSMIIFVLSVIILLLLRKRRTRLKLDLEI